MALHDAQRWFRRGVNFGNALDALDGDEPRLRLTQPYFAKVREAGFDTVRLPARWSAHAEESPPYGIDPRFFDRVDNALDNAEGHGLTVVLNVHHYHELQHAPDEHAPRFLALWRQIATRYASRSERVLFELLNEPRAAMTARVWNELSHQALRVVREIDPDRIVIVGSARMNDIDALSDVALPADDRVVATVHYYAPMRFTHQATPWTPGAERWLGTTWGTDSDRTAVRRDLTAAARWARDHDRPVFLGEFGTYEKADMTARVQWTAFVRAEAERLGLSWCYWDFGTDFGVFDTRHDTWREPLRRALIPPRTLG